MLSAPSKNILLKVLVYLWLCKYENSSHLILFWLCSFVLLVSLLMNFETYKRLKLCAQIQDNKPMLLFIMSSTVKIKKYITLLSRTAYYLCM